MNIADDLVRAFNDGYEKGKADAEAYLFHCGDTDEPQTNADRIRSMTEEELAKLLNGTHGDFLPTGEPLTVSGGYSRWLNWLKQEASDGEIHRPLH